MERDEIIQLLQVISAYDNRRIDELAIRAWSESARRANWRTTDAVEAVHEHFARATTWLMPGHITDLIRQQKRQPAPVGEVLALAGTNPASPETRQEVLTLVRELADKKSVDHA